MSRNISGYTFLFNTLVKNGLKHKTRVVKDLDPEREKDFDYKVEMELTVSELASLIKYAGGGDEIRLTVTVSAPNTVKNLFYK